jgi:hypothetical protein
LSSLVVAVQRQFDNPTKEAAGVAVGDFFGDGKLSIAVATGVGDVSVLRGNGDGTFQVPVHYLGDFHGRQPVALAAADFNGDGKPDVASTSFLTRDTSVLLNTSPAPSQGKVASTTTLASTAAGRCLRRRRRLRGQHLRVRYLHGQLLGRRPALVT